MNFSAWSIRNPIAPILAFVLLMLLGWQSFNSLPITRFPNIDVPVVSITVVQAGAGPRELEAQVTRDIEDAVASVNGVKNVTSTISDNLSTTVVEFRMEVAPDQAVQDTKDAIDGILSDLPPSAESPVVTKVDVEGQAIQIFAISSADMTMEELSWFVDDTAIRALQGRPGIGRVDRYGGVEREINVLLDPIKLGSYGITAHTISQEIARTNADLGSGKLELGAGEQSIRTLGDQSTVESLREATISLPSGRHVRLSDLGEITDAYADPTSYGRQDGNPVVVMSVYRSKGASEVSAAKVVEDALNELRAEYPSVTIQLLDDQVYFTRGNYEAALHTLVEGAVLAVLVVLAFLKNWRATFIAAVALPLSAVPTFLVLDLIGFSLNLLSFLALTLATGILVDDAIVEIENISRHMKMGKSPYRASIDAADEIGLAVVATTMTIVAVFVPVSFMPGIPGQYFRQFGVTVAVAVFFSLLVARLITPMMAAYLMRDKDAHDDSHSEGPFMRGYLWLVRKSTSVPVIAGFRVPAYYLTLAIAVVLVIISTTMMMRIPGNLFPPDDESRIAISVQLPPGAPLSQTDQTTQAMRQAIMDIEGVEHVLIIGGSSPTGERELRRANMVVLLERRDVTLTRKLVELVEALPVIGKIIPLPGSDIRTRPQLDIEEEVFARLNLVADVRAFKVASMGSGARPFSYDILSNDEEDLSRAISILEAAVADLPYLANISTEGDLPRPEIQVIPRLAEAARLGVTTQAISATLRVATIGDFDAELAQLSIDNRQIPVRVRLDPASREDLDRLAALKVATAAGGMVPLSAVADIVVSEGPAQIQRLNRQRVATIGADIPPQYVLEQATTAFEARLKGDPANGIAPLDLPRSVTVQPAGDAEVMAELLQSFKNAMLLGLLLVLTVLILLFKSVVQPFTILFSLPLAIGGVAVALLITQNPISMPVMIGLLMLMGIVTKNAILLIDFAIEMRAQGMDRITAVVEAGHKRARPIVMTSIAMAAGMLPSALGVGEGGSFRAPMAIAVIGGIIMSTILSLVIVPAFYLIMDDLSRLLGWSLGRFVGAKEPDPEAPEPEVLAIRIAQSQEKLQSLEQRLTQLEQRG